MKTRLKLHLLTYMFLMSAFFISCSDDDDNNPTITPTNPEITSISPDSAKVNSQITIAGKDFGDARGSGIVQFQGATADKDEDFISWSATSIKLIVPEGTKSGNVTVKIADDVSNTMYIKIYEDIPDTEDTAFVSALGLDSAKVGDKLEITGINFGATQGESFVKFGDIKADDYTAWEDKKIRVVVPEDAVSGDVTVTVNNIQSNAKYLIIYEPGPELKYLNPAIQKIGENIAIRGEYFGDSQGDSYVDFNGTKASVYTSWSDTEIGVKVPEGAETGPITVVVGEKVSNSLNFTLQTEEEPEGPVITLLENQNGQPGTQMGIQGQNFGAQRDGSYVEFNGVKVADDGYPLWSDTRIVVIIPDDATSGDIVVTVDGKASNGINFEIVANFHLLDLATIPAGSFTMGNDDEPDSDMMGFKPAHKVNITRELMMSETEITQKQWSTIMSQSNPSKYKLGDDYPVEQVTWLRAIAFCNELSKQEGLDLCYTINGEDVTCDFDASGYRLPTEAEWEYACRAGTTGDYGVSGDPDEFCWSAENSGNTTNPVRQKKPNAWGLFDMHGNVYEWCWDWYEYEYYSVSPSDDPTGPEEGFGLRVIRGGTFMNGADYTKSYLRESFSGVNENYNSNLGFRVVRLK